jgi:predicted Fe-Mo cluster-binding NifX family protein
MAIAIAASQDHIATVFDSADSLLIIEAGPERKKRIEALPLGATTMQVQQRLRELNVNVLLCGAIASFTRQSIEGAGIIVIPFLKGNLADVEAGFFANRLDEPAFYLPGCRRGWTGRGPGPCGGGTGGGGRGATGKPKGQRRRGRS